MKLSLNWINDYIKISDIPIDDLVDKLTMSTCEVETLDRPWQFLDQVVAAKVQTVTKHPDADKLSVCLVDAGGQGSLQIVCGAPNVKKDMWVALAIVGAKLPLKNKETWKIKTSKIRGVESSGMLCAAEEIHLSDLPDLEPGLLDLEKYGFIQKSTKPGTVLTRLVELDDTVIEIDNKSITHRPDLWCHFGFARELSAIFSRKIHWDPLDPDDKKNSLNMDQLQFDKDLPVKKIVIHDQSALAYCGASIQGVSIGPSPLWMQVRLMAIGQRPINNIVDASNYAMFESGQPNHAFDARSLTSDTIGVFKNGSGYNAPSIATLDGVTHKLPADAVLIVDGNDKKARAVALAGIMGGAGSEVQNDTTDLFLESATFPRELIRRTVSLTQIRTDSSQRFEKGQDPSKATALIPRLIKLIAQSLPDNSIKYSRIVIEKNYDEKEKTIELSLDFIQKRLGFEISKKAVLKILEALHFKIQSTQNDFRISVPSFRAQYDITRPEDIVEELGRIYGYDNITPVAPQIQLSSSKPNLERSLQNQLKILLADAGFSECYNYSFNDLEKNTHFTPKDYQSVELANPVFGDKPFLRSSQIPGLLQQATLNQDRFDIVKLFEFARIYYKTKGMKDSGDRFHPGDLALEQKHLDIVILVPKTDTKATENQAINFKEWQDARAMLYNLFFPFIGAVSFFEDKKNPLEFLHPGCQAHIRAGQNMAIGYMGLLHPVYQTQYQLKRQALLIHLNYNEIFKVYEKHRRRTDYQPPSIYQNSNLELSVLLDKTQGSHIPLEIIASLKIKEIERIEFLGTWEGQNLPANKKSVSYRMLCADPAGSISSARQQEILDLSIKALQKHNIPLR